MGTHIQIGSIGKWEDVMTVYAYEGNNSEVGDTSEVNIEAGDVNNYYSVEQAKELIALLQQAVDKIEGNELMNTFRQTTFEHIHKHINKITVHVLNGTILNSEVKEDKDGYLYISLGNLPIRVHHIIGYFIFGNRMVGKQINHYDGNKTNNKPTNLELTTPSENVRHAFDIGLKKPIRGEAVKNSKLTEQDVYEIRKLNKEGLTHQAIATKFDVAFQTVNKIVNRKLWAHLPDNKDDKIIELFNEYQQLTRRTAENGQSSYDKVSNFALGLISECGEVTDEIKKVLYHGHELDKDKILDEMGDVLWYLTQLADQLDIKLEDVATNNIIKLKTRYPQGFSSEDSIKRVDNN